jgi:hypothetical protein
MQRRLSQAEGPTTDVSGDSAAIGVGKHSSNVDEP